MELCYGVTNNEFPVFERMVIALLDMCPQFLEVNRSLLESFFVCKGKLSKLIQCLA
jgi:hypothetical protein